MIALCDTLIDDPPRVLRPSPYNLAPLDLATPQGNGLESSESPRGSTGGSVEAVCGARRDTTPEGLILRERVVFIGDATYRRREYRDGEGNPLYVAWEHA